ncbi:hypothetical protein RhiirA5_405404 [Rhizophagus irregularis]|uniref:Uncharacterized protein n=1 Tax=Rhizophagus irregularis TaxID=588596 RepID=A0A2N0QFH6_9GLOM|nr:hypothetical protein RhiirA5_405404 [Rhizophagus irregularis]CAB5122012.1 unnamed protein product [Rhizophagus irregularis]CAB5372668.1 unnamed protein product [Rhizophagus irregularis]
MENLSKIKILLDRTEPSERLHVLVLDRETHCYLNVKISLPEEFVNRKYKDILNAYMIFRIDFCNAFNVAKTNEKFRKNSGSFKDTSSLWKISPKEVTDVYEQIFSRYKELKPKKLNFITCYPQENKNESNNELESENSENTMYQINNISISQSETENPGNIICQDDLSTDEINDSISPTQYSGPGFNNFGIILDQVNECNNNTNDLNSQPETIQFENTEVLNNSHNLLYGTNFLNSQSQYDGLEFDNCETINQINVCNNTTNDFSSETSQFENSEVMVGNYFHPQYISSNIVAYNTGRTFYNSGMVI